MIQESELSKVVVLRNEGMPLPEPDCFSPKEYPIAIGEGLSSKRLIEAYRKGIFPWFDYEDRCMTWWSPDPRAVIPLDAIKLSSRQRRRMKRSPFRYSLDESFESVITECAAPRPGRESTWISHRIHDAYCQLFHRGLAHSVETWLDDSLAGGLYGVSIGRMFFGESMFHSVDNASKFAFMTLVLQLQKWQFSLIDAQQMTKHMRSLGAIDLPRAEFLGLVRENNQHETRAGSWQFDADLLFWLGNGNQR